MSGAEQDREDDLALAGEYALSLLDGDERRAFEDRLTLSAELQRDVAAWREDFISLDSATAPVAPPASVWHGIEERLFSDPATRQGGFSLLRFLSGVVAAAAVAFGVLLFLPSTEPLAQPEYRAELVSDDTALRVVASYVAEHRELLVDRRAGGAAPGRVLELWLIAAGADAPVSLGVLPDTERAVIPVSADVAAALAGGTLAISDEPPGGSPTGAPTGAVLAAGPVVAL